MSSESNFPPYKKQPLIQGIDYYIDDAGKFVFTEHYLKQRPCCGNGCKHCPYKKIRPTSLKKEQTP